MKALLLTVFVFAATMLLNCTQPNQTAEPNLTTITTPTSMKNFVSIIEIPVTDLTRAIQFYSAILQVKIEEAEMGGVQMGVFPAEDVAVNVVLAQGPDYSPTSSGCLLYLNGGENLQAVLDKIEANGGKIIVPKTEISPEMGYFALFTDTEGNKLGLHSIK